MSDDEELEGSVLGTAEHWRSTYQAELETFRSSGGADSGEVWFGEDTQATLVAFVARLVDANQLPGSRKSGKCRVLDAGCGNGALCVALSRAGFGDLTGVDYVPESVHLATAVAAAAGVAARFQVDDMCASSLPDASFDLVVDKGTLDAVGLSPDGQAARARYAATLERVLPVGGLVVITSCNSTVDELIAELSGTGAFEEVDRVRTYPTFRFGGHEGSRWCTVAFRRRQRPCE